MAGPTYRSGGEEEPLREAPVEALLPGTRERLREACERGEALASTQPRWVGRPARWLLAAGVLVSGLLVPLAFSFGRIDERPFASRPLEQATLFTACVVGLVLGALALRSHVLRRGGLPPGLFLFTSALLEIRGGRVRAWPLERLRQATQRGSEARLDLGPSGWLRLTTLEEDLGETLRRTRERLAEARDEHDETTLEQLDPCHHERAHGSFQPVAQLTPLPTWGGPMTLRRSSWSALTIAAALLGGHLVATQVRRVSDRLGIDLAWRQRDLTSLHSYVWQGGVLVDEADEAWVALLANEPDEALEYYMVLPYGRRVDQVDDLLARRVMAHNPLVSRESSGLYELKWREKTQQSVRNLRHYLSLGRPGQALRPQVEQRVFELSLALDQTIGCHESDEPLAPYLDLSNERAEQAREARWSREKRNLAHCGSLSLIESARSLARTGDQRFTVTLAWISYFERRRADTMSLVSRAATECEIPAMRATVTRLGTWQSELWEYLVAHPEAVIHRAPPRWQNGGLVPRQGVAVDERRDGQPMLVSDHRIRALFERDWGCIPLLVTDERESDLGALETPPEGPRLEYSIVGTYGANDPNVIELTFTLPGRAVRRARFVVPPTN